MTPLTRPFLTDSLPLRRSLYAYGCDIETGNLSNRRALHHIDVENGVARWPLLDEEGVANKCGSNVVTQISLPLVA